MKNRYIRKLLGESETLLYATRQHWFVVLGSLLPEILLSLVLITVVTVALPVSPILWIAYFALVFPLGSILRDLLIWFNRQYIVTNRRVIQVNGIINKNVIDSSLEKVNDVKMSQSFFGRIFGYGTIEILTASELGVNLFQKIGDPVRFKTAMLNAKEKMGYAENGVRAQSAPDIPSMIARLDDLRKQGVLSEDEFKEKKALLLSKM